MSTSGSDPYDLLDQLAEEFAARSRRGERPTVEEYVDRYPKLAANIRELFSVLVKVERADRDQQRADRVTGDSRTAEQPARQIGDFRILREIGRGGMGVVYEAEQVSLGRRVALKVLPCHVSRDRQVQERFRREARAAARLHHTNIVPVHEVGQDGDVWYYAMQFIQGLGLDAVITELLRLRKPDKTDSRISFAPEAEFPRPREEQPGQSAPGTTLGESVDRGAVLQCLLTGRFDPGGQIHERVGASQSILTRARTVRLAELSRTGMQRRAADGEPAATRTETSSATAGDTISPQREREHSSASVLSPSTSASSSSAILPGGTQLSSAESGRTPFFRSLAQIGRQVAGGLA
jgi:Protein kinase domain